MCMCMHIVQPGGYNFCWAFFFLKEFFSATKVVSSHQKVVSALSYTTAITAIRCGQDWVWHCYRGLLVRAMHIYEMVHHN